MSALDSKAGISKPPRAKPTANASNYRKYSIFLADLNAKIDMLSLKEESDIRTRFFAWMNENRKLKIWKSAEEKRNKFFEIADTILTLSRSEGIFDNLSDLKPANRNELSDDYSYIPWNIPEDVRFEWMVEKQIKSPKKLDLRLPTPVKEDKFSKSIFTSTLRRIFFTDLIIHNYLYGPYKN
jgi:hypothetical protein